MPTIALRQISRATLFALALLPLLHVAAVAEFIAERDGRTVTMHATTHRARTITLKYALGWWTSAALRNAVTLPAGVYHIEGEDNEFWYFRAPQPLEVRSQHGEARRAQTGGIALRKHPDAAVVAEIYTSSDIDHPRRKWLEQKLGPQFGKMEHDKWTRNF